MVQRTERSWHAGTAAAAFFFILGLVHPAFAQTITNPRIVEFDPSADHSVVLEGGQPAVARYDLEVYQQGATAPFHTVDLGKPGIAADGKVRHDFWSGVSAWPLPGGIYEARVTAVGPNGTGRSDASNAFTIDLAPPCSYTLAETTKNVTAATTNASVGITAPSGCGWTATTSTAWISLTTSSGSGNGAVAFTVSANVTANPRTGTIAVAGQTITVVQAGVACTYTLSTTSQSVTHTAGNASFSVTAPVGCAWTATSGANWLTPTNPSGSGTSTINYSFTANPAGTPRSTTVTVAGQAVTVTQAALPCSFSLSQTTQSVGKDEGSASVELTATSGCTWTVSSQEAWITPATTGGTGSATVSYTVAANPTTSSRTGVVTIAGQTLTVSQAAGVFPPARPQNIRIVTPE